MDSSFLKGLKLIAPTALNPANNKTLDIAWTANNKKFIPKLLEDSTALFNSVIVKEDKQYEANAAISSYLNLLINTISKSDDKQTNMVNTIHPLDHFPF